MPSFVDAFLQALPQGAQNAQQQLRLMLQEEQVKEGKKAQRQQEELAQVEFLNQLATSAEEGQQLKQLLANAPTARFMAQQLATATVPTKEARRLAPQALTEVQAARAEVASENALNKAVALLPKEQGNRLRAAFATDKALQTQGFTAEQRNRLFVEMAGPDAWTVFSIQQAKSKQEADRFATQRFWPEVAAAGIVIPNAASIFLSLAKADDKNEIKTLYARLLLGAIAQRDELTDPSAQGQFGLLSPETLNTFDSNFLSVATALGKGDEAQQFLGGKLDVRTQSIILRAHERGQSRQDILRQWEEFAKQTLGDNAIAMRNQRRQVIEWLNALERRQQRSLRR